MYTVYFAIALLSILNLKCVNSSLMTQPEQIHISYGATPDQMMITWVTFDKTNVSQVEYGPRRINNIQTGTSTLFVDGGPAKRSMYMHRVLLTGLTPGALYVYHCGSVDGWSPLFWFNAMSTDPTYSPTLAVYGDLGNVNAQSLPRLQEEVQRGVYDAILHVGDFAYDMDSDDAKVGDEFMRQLEPIAAYVPYMTCVGNHENAYNFSNYDNRFSMMNLNGDINNHFYSFNLGPAHIIAFSTEFYYFVQYGITQVLRQYLWLEEDLKEAAKPENRAKHPWIITMGHRPMYCSTDDGDDCGHKESIIADVIYHVVRKKTKQYDLCEPSYRSGAPDSKNIRKGFPVIHAFGLEDLFYKYGVDLEIWAHEHVYERLWPVYDRAVYNGSFQAPYTNPKAPVHIITGSAGCQENHDPWVPNPANWSALRNADYGYTRMKIYNSSHVHLQQVSDDKGGAVIDDFWVIKDKHGFEAWA